jgi:DNA-binding Lrp family transcriptional regulator
MTGTLVAAHIPEENLREVVKAVNSLEGVSHNYMRKHYYNLWFTLQAPAAEQIEVTLSNLSARFGIDFYSLPAEHVFKLDVRFDTENKQHRFQNAGQVPRNETVELNEKQKLILSKLQNGLEPTAKPFDFLCGEGLEGQEVLEIIKGLIDKGVIRRIAAVVDYRKLGFVANVLLVSHCYERKTFKDWPYNLFAMMHSRSMGEIQHVINEFTEAEKIGSFELLPTVAELKKRPVKHHFY